MCFDVLSTDRSRSHCLSLCKRYFGFLCVLVFMVTTSEGCRRPEVELARVEGVVKLDGKPLPDATIRFLPLGKGRAAIGRTDADGKYQMQYSARSDGAVVGKVRVEITTAEEKTNDKGVTTMGKEILPAKYHEDSELQKDVGSGKNEINFELTSN